jgi:hypothetical protein
VPAPGALSPTALSPDATPAFPEVVMEVPITLAVGVVLIALVSGLRTR